MDFIYYISFMLINQSIKLFHTLYKIKELHKCLKKKKLGTSSRKLPWRRWCYIFTPTFSLLALASRTNRIKTKSESTNDNIKTPRSERQQVVKIKEHEEKQEETYQDEKRSKGNDKRYERTVKKSNQDQIDTPPGNIDK